MLARDLFDATAKSYDQTRRKLVPCFDDFYRTVLELIPFASDAELDVVDLGAGTGLLSGLIAASFPQARIRLIDVSEEMLAQARQRLGTDSPRFHYQLGDLSTVAIPDADVVTSALAIHHLEDEAKEGLFARIFDSLRPAGVFINADQVLGPTAHGESVNHQAWLHHARAAGASEADLEMAKERMRADRTAPLLDQLRWMSEAGFDDVDCSYKSYMFAVYSGRRAG